MKIVKATKKDYKVANKLLNNLHTFHVKQRPDTFEQLEAFFSNKKEYKQYLKNHIIFLAKKDKKVLGIAVLGLERFGDYDVICPSVSSLYVRKKYRQSGVGKLLLDACYNYCVKHFDNDTQVCDYIEIGVWDFNKNAMNFYQNNGYNFKMHMMERKFK